MEDVAQYRLQTSSDSDTVSLETQQLLLGCLDSHLVHVLYTLNRQTCTALEIKLYIVSMLVAMAWG